MSTQTQTSDLVEDIALAQGVLSGLTEQVGRAVSVGTDVLEPLAVALIAGGHVLVEGIPGTGKTLLSRTLARSVDCTFKRIQFTSDLMPSDVVGSSVWRPDQGRFEFLQGPLFANVVLADEINRSSSRTLSCLLEAMEEGSVSVDGDTFHLGTPFTILATRNPIEFHGTFPIPEAALDRFLVHVELGYPDASVETDLYRGKGGQFFLGDVEPVIDRDTLLRLVAAARRVRVSAPVAEYAYRIVQTTREHADVTLGVSPRAAVSWMAAARARALLHGRDYVLPDDVRALAVSVLGHRVFLKDGGRARDLVQELVELVPVEL